MSADDTVLEINNLVGSKETKAVIDTRKETPNQEKY